MKGPRKLWITVFVLGVAGLALFIVLLVRHGLGDVGAAFAKAGWGVAAVVAFHLVVLTTNGLAWYCLFPREKRLPFGTLLFIRWIGESVQNLFPATAVGGLRGRTEFLPVLVKFGNCVCDVVHVLPGSEKHTLMEANGL